MEGTIPLELQSLLTFQRDDHEFMHILFKNPKTKEFKYDYYIPRKRTWRIPRFMTFLIEIFKPQYANEKLRQEATVKGPTLEESERAIKDNGVTKATVFSITISSFDEKEAATWLVRCDNLECAYCQDGIQFKEFRARSA